MHFGEVGPTYYIDETVARVGESTDLTEINNIVGFQLFMWSIYFKFCHDLRDCSESRQCLYKYLNDSVFVVAMFWKWKSNIGKVT